MRKHSLIFCVVIVIISVLLVAWGFFGDRSAPPPVKLGVDFLGYTNGFMGKRFAIIMLTNRSDKPVRVWPNFVLEYSAPLAGRTSGADLSERVLRRGEGVTDTVEVFTQPNSARWRLHLETSWATTSERFRRRWDLYTQGHSWTWWLPYSSRVDPHSEFTTEWFGP